MFGAIRLTVTRYYVHRVDTQQRDCIAGYKSCLGY